jgi:1,4-dihydroxy-2-naphthoate octaprenyltransferase
VSISTRVLPAPAEGVRVWLLAIRPQTLTAAVVPVLVGTALAARAGGFRAAPAAAALLGALLIQIGTNLANDVGDFERGADAAARVGPVRVTQSGLLTPRQVRGAAWSAFAAAALAGLYLIASSGWPIAVLGIAAIVSGWAYTGGPWPLGYNGLGDLFVFAFFGLAAVGGTFYVQAGAPGVLVWLAAVPVGALASAILVVNNARDVDGDRAAGKRTLAVRLGREAARAEFALLLGLAYTVPVLLWWEGLASAPVLLPWLTLPWAAHLARLMAIIRDGADFNAALRSTARLHALFGALFAAGLLL